MSEDKLTRRISVLKDVSIFDETSEESLEDIAKALSYELIPKGTTIVHKGEIGDSMFIIESGRVKIHDEDYVFDILKVDDVFGEYYLIDSEERSASVTTLEETELLRIHQNTFYQLMAKNIHIIKGILKSSIKRLRKMNEIEEEIASKKVEIEKQKNDLIELNATKDKFFSIIAHDLRGPLGTIISFFEFLNSNINSLEKSEIVDLVESIYNSTNKLMRLLNNLLEWSRVQTGQLTCKPEIFDLFHIVQSNVELLRMHAEKKDVVLYSKIRDNIKVYADKNMINTVLRNLISNAIKFTASGGSVWISAEKTNHEVAVSVHDTGVGMSEKAIRKLFRLDLKYSTIGTNEEKGSGLGLHLCKEFVEKNNGSIKIKSKPEKGTTVTFTVPLKDK